MEVAQPPQGAAGKSLEWQAGKAAIWKQMSGADNEYFAKLIEVLLLIAASADVQEVVLAGTEVTDELALLLDQYAPLVKRTTVLPPPISEKLEQLDSTFSHFSQHPELDAGSFWSVEALRQSEEWSAVRKLSKSILSELGVELRAPNLSWIFIMPSSAEE